MHKKITPKNKTEEKKHGTMYRCLNCGREHHDVSITKKPIWFDSEKNKKIKIHVDRMMCMTCGSENISQIATWIKKKTHPSYGLTCKEIYERMISPSFTRNTDRL